MYLEWGCDELSQSTKQGMSVKASMSELFSIWGNGTWPGMPVSDSSSSTYGKISSMGIMLSKNEFSRSATPPLVVFPAPWPLLLLLEATWLLLTGALDRKLPLALRSTGVREPGDRAGVSDPGDRVGLSIILLVLLTFLSGVKEGSRDNTILCVTSSNDIVDCILLRGGVRSVLRNKPESELLTRRGLGAACAADV